jgi:ferric-dicitrate binding protein FerR (iron transport regulator)
MASVLTPGQQAEVLKQETNLPVRVKQVDVTEVMAWKDNLFNFNNTDLPGIMRQLARWYDVEVVYAGNVPVRHFSGKINRSLPLSIVLEILEQSSIRFKIKGKQIVVKS